MVPERLIALDRSNHEATVFGGNRLSIPKVSTSSDFPRKFFKCFEWGCSKSRYAIGQVAPDESSKSGAVP